MTSGKYQVVLYSLENRATIKSNKFPKGLFYVSFLVKLSSMFRQRVIVMLILIMAIMPVSLAFAHYSDIASQFSAARTVVAVGQADNVGNSSLQHGDHCQPNKLHPAGCSDHVCVDCALTTSFDFVSVHSPAHYIHWIIPDSISLIAPPDIKPPISIL